MMSALGTEDPDQPRKDDDDDNNGKTKKRARSQPWRTKQLVWVAAAMVCVVVLVWFHYSSGQDAM
jgi:hypothetical protein